MNRPPPFISAAAAWAAACTGRASPAPSIARRLIDVRAPVEYRDAAIPGFTNLPILDDEQRHRVGIAYRAAGSEGAVALGLALVGPHREARVRAWLGPDADGPLLVTCFRGGLRSEFALRWILEVAPGRDARRVEGGYKALRRIALAVLAAPPPFVALAGLTGTGKSALLRDPTVQAAWPTLDLERAAAHRGSAFGLGIGEVQPAQATFENTLALELSAGDPCLIEDESAMLGARTLPPTIREGLRRAPLVWLEAPLGERVERLVGEYVWEPRSRGIADGVLLAHLTDRLGRLARRLGDERARRIRALLTDAFHAPADPEGHRAWVRALLVEYYDPLYAHAAARGARSVLFRGSWEAARAYLQRTPTKA